MSVYRSISDLNDVCRFIDIKSYLFFCCSYRNFILFLFGPSFYNERLPCTFAQRTISGLSLYQVERDIFVLKTTLAVGGVHRNIIRNEIAITLKTDVYC